MTRGRPQLPEDQKRQPVRVKLPPELVAWLRTQPNGVTATVEKAVKLLKRRQK